jgi:hypothetical protein
MTDLSTIVAAERAIDIKHPATDELVGLRLTILPDTHPQVRAASRKLSNERLAGRGKLTAEKLEAGRIDMLVASVGGWQWEGLTLDGETPEYSDANLRKVIKRFTWIGDQIDREVADRAEFFRGADQAAA